MHGMNTEVLPGTLRAFLQDENRGVAQESRLKPKSQESI